jgi:hypothetical protein
MTLSVLRPGARVSWRGRLGTVSYARFGNEFRTVIAYSIVLDDQLHRGASYEGTIVNASELQPAEDAAP